MDLPPLSLVFETCPLWTGQQLGGLCGARPHGQQQSQTTACGWCCRWWVTSSGCPWITPLEPLSHDGHWRVHRTWQSLEGDGLPFWKHDLPIGAGISRSWLWCWKPQPALGLRCWWWSCSSDVEGGAQAALVEALEEAKVAVIGDPGLREVKKSDENNSPKDTDLCFALMSDFYSSTLVCIVCQKELLAFASLLSISLSNLASDEMAQPR